MARFQAAALFTVSSLALVLFGLLVSAAPGPPSPSLAANEEIQICERKLSSGGLQLTLKNGVQRIAFKCSDSVATLKPSTTQVYTKNDGSGTLLLNEACHGAALVDSKGDEPKTYTLEVPLAGRKEQVLYWNCQVPVSPASVAKEQLQQQQQQQEESSMKDCTVQIMVKQSEPGNAESVQKPDTSLPPPGVPGGAPTSEKVYQCEPKPEGAVVPVLLPSTEQTVFFNCGPTDTRLTPDPQYKQFYEDEQCTDPELLSKVCPGTTLVPKEGETNPTTYKLTVPVRGRHKRIMYFKCTARGVILQLRSTGKMPDQNPSSCTLQITVDGPVDPDNDDDDLSPHDSDDDQDDQMDDLFETCEIDDDENKMEHITLPSKRKRVSFSCGTAGAPTLTPEASENKFCVDPSCSEQKLLSSLFPGATFVATPSSGTTIYSLSFKSKLRADHELYYVCTATKAVQDRDDAGAVEGTQKKKKCTIKLTIKGQNPLLSASAQKVTPPYFVCTFIVALIHMFS
ncbi:hypothetical protein BESB_034000 [Besnoitia besnoiti]|uniref:SAG-related sequence n=1 Tax=Besnoitia besnoiti TaxID=94643 RepID=A0A2A9MMX9_BESBE|nr:hypothetical protein BESB_034000 [Besnoitia besnoiti]PFH36942.1 hypothetical protein BESB_034000 [Besnoitia besnoiti]